VALTITPSPPLPPPSAGTGRSPVALSPAHSYLSPARIPVSATLAANETMDARRRRGEPVLPLAFGEAGLPAHPMLRAALARAAGCNSYGPVAGHAALREAASCYWARRGLPTGAEQVICGPGSKPLLFGLMAALDGDVAVTRPSWVSYAAQAALSGRVAHFVPGRGGVPDAQQLARAVSAARAGGRRIRSVIVTLPDNPTGLLAAPAAVRAVCAVAEAHDLIIISDEIYRDLVHDADAPFTSPAVISPERTVVTTGLSKNLALGGWRLGVARLPGGELGRELAVARRFAAAGVAVPAPQAAFYLYPDFSPLADVLLERHGITSDESLAAVLLRKYGVGVLPGSSFGEESGRLRLRVATAMLYGDTDTERHAALDSADPCSLPWIAASLARLEEVLTDLTG
jgi:aspartate aminotransferase